MFVNWATILQTELSECTSLYYISCFMCVQMFLSLLSDLRDHVKMLAVSCGVRGEQPLQLTKCVFNSFWTTVRLSVEEERNGFELHGRYLGQFIVCFCLLIKTGDYFIEIFFMTKLKKRSHV